MGRYFVLTAAFGLLFNRKPCQVRFNSLQLQGSPWFHLFLADFSLDLFLVLLLLVLVFCFSCSFFICFGFGLLFVWAPCGSFSGPLGCLFVFSCFGSFCCFVVGSFLAPRGFWFGFLSGSFFVCGCVFCPLCLVFVLFWVSFWPPFWVPLVSFLLAASVAGFMRNHLSNHVSKAIRLLTFA